MAGLFSSLSMAARSLEAQRAGLDTAGRNIANLNTPGYPRLLANPNADTRPSRCACADARGFLRVPSRYTSRERVSTIPQWLRLESLTAARRQRARETTPLRVNRKGRSARPRARSR